MNNDKEFRSFELIKREKTDEPEYIVEGYASTFERYVLFREGETDYCEQIDEHAFDDADFSDCVFRVDHEGAVYARTSAGTVSIDIDEHGLHTVTDLSKTSRGRALFEDIMAGNYPQMSFAFTVAKDSYERDTHTRIIDRIDKVYDIAAVTWPANPTTSLSARSKNFFDGVIEEEKAERLENERKANAWAQIEKALGGAKNDN